LIQDNLLNYYDCGFVEFEKEKEIADEERDKRIERFLQLNRNPDPATPLFRTYLQYRDWREKRHARQVLLAGKFTFKAPEPLSGGSDEKQDDISLIKVENVRFSYDPAKGLPFIFDTPISYNVTMSTRVGIMGPNGAGKSTFLKLITGKLTATEGSISTHPTYSLAYFGQHSTKELKLDMSPLEFMQWSFPGANIGELKSHLEKSSISGHTMNAAMSNLSFSQRSCVIFAKLTYVPPHLLIMDEPTNFLDLDSVDSLIGAVNKFKGAVIIVTHNRDFLKKCCRDFLSIIPGAFLEFKTMKEAERATYSFITALEEGKPVDFKRAIMENRGGGAVHTEEELAERAKRLELQQLLAQKKEEEKKAEEERLAKIAAEKEAKRLAREAQKKTDWAADEACFFPVNGKWTPAIVVRNVPRMGVTIKFASGKTMMVEATKLRSEIPEGGAATGPEKKEAPASGGRGGKTGGRGGSAAGSKPRGGAAAGGRGGKPRGGAAPRGGRK
jgi:ABC-type Mn2+/Zn2+ transport system ATPase subunit